MKPFQQQHREERRLTEQRHGWEGRRAQRAGEIDGGQCPVASEPQPRSASAARSGTSLSRSALHFPHGQFPDLRIAITLLSKSVLTSVHWDCSSRTPQTGTLQTIDIDFSQFWKSQIKVTAEPASEDPFLVHSRPASRCVFTWWRGESKLLCLVSEGDGSQS